jgi:hypothetical protein
LRLKNERNYRKLWKNADFLPKKVYWRFFCKISQILIKIWKYFTQISKKPHFLSKKPHFFKLIKFFSLQHYQ